MQPTVEPGNRSESYSELVPLKVKEIIKLLERHDWRHVRTSGDHRIYKSPDGRVTVVSGTLSEEVRPGTWRAILRQTGIEGLEK